MANAQQGLALFELDVLISAICKSQHQFQLDVFKWLLVLNFNFSNNIGPQYSKKQSGGLTCVAQKFNQTSSLIVGARRQFL